MSFSQPQPQLAWGLNDVCELCWTPRESSCSWHREPSGGFGTHLAEKSAWDGLQWGPSCRQGISWKQRMKEKAGSSQATAPFSSPLQPRGFPHLIEDEELRSSAEEEETPQPNPAAGGNQGSTLAPVPICVSQLLNQLWAGILSAAVTRDRNRCLGLREFSPPPSKLYIGTEICQGMGLVGSFLLTKGGLNECLGFP